MTESHASSNTGDPLPSEPPGNWWADRFAPATVIGVALAVIGYVVGWFVGASQSPVVATLLPLVIGLLGAVSLSLMDHKGMLDKVLDSVKKMSEKKEIDGTVQDKIHAAFGATAPSFWMAAAWAVGVAIFTVSCFFGSLRGVDRRVPKYPPLAELIGADTFVTAYEVALLNDLRWRLGVNNVPPEDVKAMFSASITPILSAAAYVPGAPAANPVAPVRPDVAPPVGAVAPAAPAKALIAAAGGPRGWQPDDRHCHRTSALQEIVDRLFTLPGVQKLPALSVPMMPAPMPPPAPKP